MPILNWLDRDKDVKVSESVPYNKGFTLVEIAIVLVIVGLLVGGVLVGKELISASREKKLFRDIKDLQVSIVMFKGKYKELPGDIDRAYAFWGSECGSSEGNCNGNGNGTISEGESLKLFKHLYLAGLTKFVSHTDSTSVAEVGANVMPSDYVDGAGFLIMYNSLTGSVGSTHNVRVAVNGITSTPGNFLGAIMTGIEAKEFDVKYDDGYPWEGDFNFRRGGGLSGSLCSNFSRPGVWYEDTGISCFFYFRIEKYENQF